MLLFLSDVAGSEVLLILLVILIFFGPKSIPGIAKTFGKTIYQIKQASDELKSEITKSGMEIKKELNLDKILKDTSDEIEREIVSPLEKEVNEVDHALNSVSYTPKSRIPTPVSITTEEGNILNDAAETEDAVITENDSPEHPEKENQNQSNS